MSEPSGNNPRAGSVGPWEADAAEILSYLAEPTRLQILLALADGEVHVGDLCQRVARAQPSISHHLSILRRTGIVTTRKQGKLVYYSLASPPGDALIKVDHRRVNVSVKRTATAPEDDLTT